MSSDNKKRPTGYYWVRIKGGWVVAFYSTGDWYLSGYEGKRTSDILQVDETPIRREENSIIYNGENIATK